MKFFFGGIILIGRVADKNSGGTVMEGCADKNVKKETNTRTFFSHTKFLMKFFLDEGDPDPILFGRVADKNFHGTVMEGCAD